MRGEYSRVGARIPDPNTSSSPTTVPLYLRTIATISSWASLAGYTLFALIFTSQKDNVKLSRSAVASLAIVLVTAGYLGAAATFILARHSPSVQYNAVLLPFLLTSVGGLIEIVINHAAHKTFPVGNSSTYIYAPLIVAALTTILFTILSFLAYQHIRKDSSSIYPPAIQTPAWDSSSFTHRDQPGQNTELLPVQTIQQRQNPYARYETAAPRATAATTTTAANMDMDMNDMIPEDEAQRRQLLRLLLAREMDRGPSPDNSSTYKIDWPGDDPPRPRPSHTRHLSVPELQRPRAGSAPSITDRWHMTNLLGKKRSSSRETNEIDGDVPDAREARRREIERNSLLGSTETLGLGLYSNTSAQDITRREARYSR